MNDDKVMICFYKNQENSEPVRVCSFYTSNFSEWLKTFDYARKNHIDFYPHDFAKSIPIQIREDIGGIGTIIDDLYIRFGDDDCIQCIDVIFI